MSLHVKQSTVHSHSAGQATVECAGVQQGMQGIVQFSSKHNAVKQQ
jgi:hypothetical protein